MKYVWILIQIIFCVTLHAQDWLVKPFKDKAKISTSGQKIELNNGLVKRVFVIQPNVACVDYSNLSSGQQLLRSIEPEAKLILNNITYKVGGLKGQKEKAYLLNDWIGNFTNEDSSFRMVHYEIGPIAPFIQWKRNSWAMNEQQPSGQKITFDYSSSLPAVKDIKVHVVYELYDGLPLITKSLWIENKGSKEIKINRIVNEVLGLVEEESAVVGKPEEMKKQHGIYVETNYAFNNAMRYDISDQTTHWKTDPE